MLERAIISVYDKTGIVEFAEELVQLGCEILSTGGTARLLDEHHIKAKKISDFTGAEEILDGRVKTLHPKIYAGILADQDNENHKHQIKKLNYEYIDVVVVNLYPFEEVVAQPGVTLADGSENIDMGGVTLIRAAAKNFKRVMIRTDPKDYKPVINRLKKFKEIDMKTRKLLAAKAFKRTVLYDRAIANYLTKLQMR